jgi:hypothetical protein
MQRTGATIIALGAFLTAASPTLAQGFGPYGAYPPPRPAGLSPPDYGPRCFRYFGKRNRDKGIRFWTGQCRHWG